MQKKIILGITIFMILIVGGYFTYSYIDENKDQTTIGVGAPVDRVANGYSEPVTIAGFPDDASSTFYENMEAFMNQTYEARQEMHDIVNEPYEIFTDITFVDKKTIVNFNGTYTDDDGVVKEYEKVLTFDFVLTEDVSYSEGRRER